MDNYHVLEMIGEGSFGKVYKGRKKYTGKVVALKFIPKLGRSEKDIENLRREIEIMRELHNENIIEMLDSFETAKEVVAVTDYAEGELFQILEDDGSLPEHQVQVIAAQLVSALHYLHSHRILHRDMKPQNILLGKGGVAKLCDFGFARAMSINTLVLTSIKGTPLYMAPELVEEKPYDHTADLWSLGCILYELFVGTPPFYTNSIFQLVSLIIKDPVKWPKNMSPEFKDFLQGLLTKNPRARLSWPQLLHHPFVANKVQVSPSSSSELPEQPFTEEPTPQQKAAREKASRQKASNLPAGTTIMRKLKGREAQQEESPPKQEAWTAKKASSKPSKDPPPSTAGKSEPWNSLKEVEPTPREDRITQDYAQEFPSVEVESRKVVRREGGAKGKEGGVRKSIEQVKLTEEEELDSEDEWDTLCDTSSPESCDPDSVAALLKDEAFVSKVAARLKDTSEQVLEGMLEGASRLRLVYRVVSNILEFRGDLDLLLAFCSAVDIPRGPVKLMNQLKDKPNVKKQPWCVQILMDLTTAITAFMVSEVGSTLTLDRAKTIMEVALSYADVLPWLLHVKQDDTLQLRAQTIVCFIYQCEAMDRSPAEFSTGFYASLASAHADIVPAFLACLMDDPIVMKKLQGSLPDSQLDAVSARWEELCGMAVGGLAELVFIPMGADSCVQGKRQMAKCVGTQLSLTKHKELTHNYLRFLTSPVLCENALKTVYFCCQVSKEFCEYLALNQDYISILLWILQGKVEIEDMYQNTVYEMTLQTLATIITQLGDIPQCMVQSSVIFAAILLDSQVASQTTAAALLVSQLLYHGVSIEMPTDDLLAAVHSALTDLSQICVRCPFDYGVLDGLLLLLCQFLSVGPSAVSRLLIESGVWQKLWHRLLQTLGAVQPDDFPIEDIEDELADCGPITSQPQWGLISPSGLTASLQIVTIVFTQEPYQCVPLLCNSDGVVMLSLTTLLSRDFLAFLAASNGSEQDLSSMVVDIILNVSQLLCFPFALDTHDMLMEAILSSLQQSHVLTRLINACMLYLKPEDMEVPLGLLSRFVLSHDAFVTEFAEAVTQLKADTFLKSLLSLDSPPQVQGDLLSICSHLARSSAVHLMMLKQVLQGQKGDYACLQQLLSSKDATVQARSCGMLGNLMRHSNGFYAVLKKREDLVTSLLGCLTNQETDVKKAASYAVGNAAYHSAELYTLLADGIPSLVQLLMDPQGRTRCNAAGALGNLARHSSKLCTALNKHKAPECLLEISCHDTQHSVQEVCLLSLRSMARHSQLTQGLLKQHAIEKLTHLSEEIQSAGPTTPGSLSSARSDRQNSARQHSARQHSARQNSARGNSASVIAHHCSKLIMMLKRSGSAAV
ncbi:serine/threonine-protein kinase 36-like isoform X2 [Patiria miniata]|uniref:non-specific serine/threonine protein kinase n=1 Tax=Patiria miniata TaxID=46514 RepID=A0A914A6C8_PATMI|nr:serine/threonine-protein kinase 36-like isoform X1 [Patiria miniata]XP_038058961.1 serine/threonine-protein kinase 36-like isoform X1 [Patiria miniata]XP_038058962.1 serine/threonine-protein kinase 36-like isoform X2 [Patiria miniata]